MGPGEFFELRCQFNSGPDGMRIIAAESPEARQPQFESIRFDPRKIGCELARCDIADVAREPQRDVVALRLHPSCAGQRHAQAVKFVANFVRNLDGGEQSGHNACPRSKARQSTASPASSYFPAVSRCRMCCKNV